MIATTLPPRDTQIGVPCIRAIRRASFAARRSARPTAREKGVGFGALFRRFTRTAPEVAVAQKNYRIWTTYLPEVGRSLRSCPSFAGSGGERLHAVCHGRPAVRERQCDAAPARAMRASGIRSVSRNPHVSMRAISTRAFVRLVSIQMRNPVELQPADQFLQGKAAPPQPTRAAAEGVTDR